ncbi:MAG: flagellar hook-associated protein FlgK, partial [Pirellulaceae bacterium]|nr:flagellar hook-associated protein FlgK [Pirellulaceae bacterium]
MPNFSLGLSALRSSQYALEVVSNNIANANTEGYHRRSVHLEALPPNQVGRFRVGNGVGINHIQRIRNSVTEASLTNVVSDVHHVDQLLEVERQIEYAFLSGNTSIGQELDQFFAEMTKLTAAPDEAAQRSAVIESGRRMAGIMRQSSVQLGELKSAVKFQIAQEVDALNGKMTLLAELSGEIQSLAAQGYDPNTELDQRDALVNEIAEVIGISRNDYFSNELNLMVGTASIQQSNTPSEFSIKQEADGEISIVLDDSERPINVGSGRLIALLEVYNSTIPKYEDKLDQLAVEMMRSFDSVHATGIGT